MGCDIAIGTAVLAVCAGLHQETQNELGRAVQNWTGTNGVLEIYVGDKLVRRFLEIDKLSTAYGTQDDSPRPYRYGYGVLDANLNGTKDPGEKKVYFEFSDYSTPTCSSRARAERNLARLLLGVVLLLTLIAAGTYWAGEQTEVAVLRTSDTLGRGHETKMWVVDHQGVPWVRVANPERGWYRRLLEQPRVELVRAGETQPSLAELRRARIAWLDAVSQYGLVDWWYGLLLRRHRSVSWAHHD
jgi:hypothetical protein